MTRDLWDILRKASPDVRKANSHLLESATKQKRTAAGKTMAPGQVESTSAAEGHFLQMWLRDERPNPQCEYQFHPSRKWRFDFAWPDAMVAVEIEGGQWIQGRHNRPMGFRNDAEKYNAATALGWRVFRLTPAMITPANLDMVIEAIEATK